MRIVLAGPPGSGKSSHGPLLADKYVGVCFASASQLLKSAIEKKTYLGDIAAGYLDKGKVIPDETLVDIVAEKLRKDDECVKGYIIEGVPKNLAQLELMKKKKINIDALVLMDLSDEVSLQRTTGRWIHRPSNRIYHETLAPPKKPGFDDVTNEPLVRQMADESELAVIALAKYRRDIEPVLAIFRGQGTLRIIDAAQSSFATRQLLFTQLNPFYVKNAKPWWKFW